MGKGRTAGEGVNLRNYENKQGNYGTARGNYDNEQRD